MEIGGTGGGLRLRRVLAGEGMLMCIKSFVWTTLDGELASFRGGVSRIVPDHEIAVTFPHLFEVACPDDIATRRLHEELLQDDETMRAHRDLQETAAFDC
jgi:hypothetical protein